MLKAVEGAIQKTGRKDSPPPPVCTTQRPAIKRVDCRRAKDRQSIFAFPSITRNEAFGVVLAESMYCGCPSVTFTIKGSGVNWVSVNGETGIEVENSDYKAYAAALDRLLTDSALREKLSKNAVQRVKELFSKEIVEKAYREIYNRLLTGDKG